MSIGRITVVRMLLVMAVLALVGLYGHFYAREFLAKWAFTHQTYFASDRLIRISVPKAELSHQTDFLATEGEFEWMGEMVDVLYREIRSDTLYVYGFRDDAETELKQEAPWLYEETAHVDQTLGSRPGSRRKLIKWRTIFDLPYLTEFNQLPQATWHGLKPTFQYCSLLITRPELDVLSPPPNL
ncbi:hypothetical protein BH09BAC4_BH09BAC4_27140 [soil metagenome]